MQTIRKIIFYLFVLAYLIICPLLILYSFGYILNPIKQEISRTGVIFLSTTPQGADVFLERSHYKNKTPATISELLPGTYKIRIRLQEHKDWLHSVTVKPGKAVAFENILILPKRWRQELLSKENYLRLIPIPKTDIFLVAKGTGLGSYLVYDYKNEKIMPLLSSQSPFFNFPVINIFSQESSPSFIIYGGSLWNRRYLLLRWAQDRSEITDLSRYFIEKPDIIEWSAKNSDRIFIGAGNDINYLDRESMQFFSQYLKGIKGFGLKDNWLYVLDKEDNVIKYSLDKETRNIIFNDYSLGEELFGNEDFYDIKILDENTLLFLSKKGQFITNRPPYKIVNKGLKGASFYRDKQQLLLWTRNSIGILNLISNNEKEPLFRDLVEYQVVFDKGRDIQQCFWADNGSHIVFLDKDNLYLIELEPDGQHHVEEITKVANESAVFYSDDSGSIYYLEPQRHGLVKIEIIPQEGIKLTSFGGEGR